MTPLGQERTRAPQVVQLGRTRTGLMKQFRRGLRLSVTAREARRHAHMFPLEGAAKGLIGTMPLQERVEWRRGYRAATTQVS